MNARTPLVALAAAAALAAALPASASAEEPLACKIVNNASTKTLGEPILVCIDDPQPDPVAVAEVDTADWVDPVPECVKVVVNNLPGFVTSSAEHFVETGEPPRIMGPFLPC